MDDLIRQRDVLLGEYEAASGEYGRFMVLAITARQRGDELAARVNAINDAIRGYPPAGGGCRVEADVPAVVEGGGR